MQLLGPQHDLRALVVPVIVDRNPPQVAMGPARLDPRRHDHRIAEKQRGLFIVGIAVQVQRVA
ncbi:hypothetical protein D3C84_1228700 [compost metagenome]